MVFINKTWEQMTESEKGYIRELPEEILKNRWKTEQGKMIIQKVCEINKRYGSSKEYECSVGTIKSDFSDKKPKYDLRGISFSGYSSIIDNEIFAFDFSNCDLRYSDFSHSQFIGSNFSNCDILYSDFSYSVLSDCNFSGSNLTLTRFVKCILESANFCKAWLSDVSFMDANLGYALYDNKTDFQNIDVNAFQGASNPIFINYLKRKQYLKNFKVNNRILYYIWWVTSDCGQSFTRWLLWSLGISLFYGIIFNIFNDSFIISSNRPATGFTFFYYSIVIFTTLGFGDIVPINIFGEVLVVLEVISGYLMLGGLITILSNKFIPKI